MFTDAFLQFSSSQSVVGVGPLTIDSTNVADMANQVDLGEGDGVVARIQVNTAVVGATGITFNLVGADNPALTTNPVVVASSGEVLAADLGADAQFVLDPNPQIGSLGKRYYGMQYVLDGTSTAGAVSADLGLGVQDGKKFYPSGFSVS